MKYSFNHRSDNHDIDLLDSGDGCRVLVSGREYLLEDIHIESGQVRFRLEGRELSFDVARQAAQVWVAHQGRTYQLEKTDGSRWRSQAGSDNPEGELRAPMPGQVRDILAAVDEQVEQGQTVMILEAMKMEIRIQAACDGRVVRLPVAIGEQINKDQILIVIE